MLDAQRRFLDASRGACELDPPAHPHQLAALDRELALAAQATGVREYLAASANVLELGRAEALDAAWNGLRVAQAVEDRRLERAAAQAYVAIVQDWPDLPAPVPVPSPGALFARATLLALEVRLGGAADAGEHLAGAVRELHAADPGFDPAAPEYARRVPWRERPDWLPRGEGAGPPAPPDVGAAARAWHERLHEPAPRMSPVRLEPGVPPPPAPADLAALAAAPLRAGVERALHRQTVWPDPLVERHHRELLAALDAAGTRTQVALAAAYADACLAIEGDWNALLHAVLVAPLRAMCGAVDATRAGDLAARLLGADPLRLRRARDLLERCAELARQPEVTLGAEAGEAGFELLADLRAHIAAGAAPPVLDGADGELSVHLPQRPVLAAEPRL